MMRAALVVAVATGACGRVDFGLVGDASPDAGACGPDVLLCESFDNGWSAWTEMVSQGLLEPTPSPHGGGVCAQSTAQAGFARLHATFGAVTSGTLHARFYVLLPSGYATSGQFDFLHLMEPPSFDRIHIFVQSVGDPLSLHVDGIGLFDSMLVLAPDRWTCVELALDVHPISGAATLAVDGAIAGTIGPGNSAPQFGWGVIYVGLEDPYAGSIQAPGRVCFDEVAIARSPLGCL